MADWKLRLYHQMPPVLRNAAATLRGYQLRAWRYGADTERLVEEALERDSWSSQQWKAYQEQRLSYILHRAATQVPYYKEQWAARRRNGDKASVEVLENWHILKKEAVRSNSLAFLAEDCQPEAMYIERTSGTSGTPLQLYISRQNLRQWYALFEARSRRWYNLTRHKNWAILGGQPVVHADATRPPFWAWNAALNQLYLSANHVSKRNAQAFVRALRDYKITHIIAYTSSATYLAEQILELGIQPNLTHLKAIVTNAEPLFDWQRNILAQAFQCEIHETYGLGEMVVAANADHKQRLRLWHEPGYVEVLDDVEDRPLEQGQVGRLICTSLLNVDMPLIRYEIGDRSGFSTELPDSNDPIQNPILLPVQGRNRDALIADDGRRVFSINSIFYGMAIAEAQVIQERISGITIKYVASKALSDEERDEISNRLALRLGEVVVSFERCESIPRGANGKFRPVICNLSTEERNQLRSM